MDSAMKHTGESSNTLQVLNAYHAAMVGARTLYLQRLLAPGFTLVHITGYVQPMREWLELVESGDFNYHQIDLEPHSLEISFSGNTATVNGRGIFSATINGINAPWKLSFTMQLVKHNDVWKIANACYSSY